MSSRRRRKTSRTRRLDGNDAQQRQAAHAAMSFWHGRVNAANAPGNGSDGTSPADTSGKAASEASQSQDQVPPDTAPPLVFDRPRRITVTADPTSTVRSLGKPPLAGREVVAEHYFEAVYKRAVAMAGALAAAGDLLADDDSA